MIVIIVGNNRVEYCKIKTSDQQKKLFVSRQQLYKVVPEGLVRMRRHKEDGSEIESEEVMIYREGSSAPYDTMPGVTFYQEDVLPEIDMIKGSIGPSSLRKNALLMKAKAITDNLLLPYGGLIIVGLVIAYALIAG